MKSESQTPEVIELSLLRDYNTKPYSAQHYSNRKKISLYGLVSESLDQFLPDLKTESSHGSDNLMLEKETPD